MLCVTSAHLGQGRSSRSEDGLAWRAPLVAAGVTGSALATQAGLARTLTALAGLAVAGLVGWRLRFRPSEQARAWQRGAHGEQQTARLLDRLGRDGYPSPARLGHSGLPRQHRLR